MITGNNDYNQGTRQPLVPCTNPIGSGELTSEGISGHLTSKSIFLQHVIHSSINLLRLFYAVC